MQPKYSRTGFYAGLDQDKIVDLYTGEIFAFLDSITGKVILLVDVYTPPNTLHDEIKHINGDTNGDPRILPLFCGNKTVLPGMIVDFDGVCGFWEYN